MFDYKPVAPLFFNEETHTYTHEGVIVPSVTEICRFASYDKADGANKWQRDLAADRGSRVHAFCQELDYDGDVQISAQDADCAGYLAGYRDFLRDQRIKGWLLVESVLFDEGNRIAGTIDRLGWIDGALTLVDIKTSASANKPGWTAQLSGYAHLAECEGYAVERLLVAQLAKNGDYRTVPIVRDRELFHACLTMHRACESFKRRRAS